ncbi:MmcQ/YjbR family DNA-binding protein [Micromonosporaceae bacterium Da 78-11]
MAVTYEQARDWVLALPGGREVYVERWGTNTLRYGDKMLAMVRDDGATLAIKATRAEQAELVDGAPEIYAPAPYVGRFGWVTAALARADPAELRAVLEDAWRRTAPKKVVQAYDSAES